MIFYLTFNDAPSGIFSSQVIDVVKFLREELKAEIKLVSFISLRSFFKNRAKIKSQLKDAIVVPMFPGLKNWKQNKLLLAFLLSVHKPEKIIARSVLACSLALNFKSKITKVIYDGRGAIAAEWNEYDVIRDQKMLKDIPILERACVNDTDQRIAVSAELINYWKSEYNYNSGNHVIIPCTLNSIFEDYNSTTNNRERIRKEFGFQDNDILFVYSGSIAGWQSFDLIRQFVSPLLTQHSYARLLFLSASDKNINSLREDFPEKVVRKSVSPLEVPHYLAAADYGLLIREQSATNRVASPVKFAEYLACGLPVIISENLGDYTEFVQQQQCGSRYQDFTCSPVSESEKEKVRKLARQYFTKQAFKTSYKTLLNK